MKELATFFLLIIFIFCNSLGQSSNLEKKENVSESSGLKKNRIVESSIYIPTLYWAVNRTVAMNGWFAVFGGEVVQVKKRTEEDTKRKFVEGKLKVEKIFLNFADEKSAISVNDFIWSEGFDGLKKGDKVVFFVDFIYERELVRTNISGTTSKLGFKVKNWNEPIVTVLEKVAPCSKITESWVEGHPKDFKAKIYDCWLERTEQIIENKENAEIWKRYDLEGFQELSERLSFVRNQNQDN